MSIVSRFSSLAMQVWSHFFLFFAWCVTHAEPLVHKSIVHGWYPRRSLSIIFPHFFISAVGKSAILTRFSENAFLNNYSSTIGTWIIICMCRVIPIYCYLCWIAPNSTFMHDIVIYSNCWWQLFFSGIDFNSRMIRVDHSICKLEIWDTAGQERFSTITANY